jgi:hypothetical protein
VNVIDEKSKLEHTIIIQQAPAIQIERMCTWCHELFGKRHSIVDRGTFGPDGTWQCLLYRKYEVPREIIYEFSFDNEKDAVLFALRWA